MRHVVAVLGLVVVFTLSLMGIIQSRKNSERHLTKTSYFGNVKHRVTNDVLKEVQTNIAEANIKLAQTKKQVAELQTAVKAAQEAADGKTAELNTCTSDLNQITADIVAVEAEKNNTEIEFQRNKTSLMEQITNLKTESEKRSKVCDYVIKSSVEGMKLCGVVPVLQAEPKQ